jgi:two-component system chemotaxis response regulator CheB
MARVVVIGASQGGVTALHTLISGLTHDFPAPILVALHIGGSPSILPSILSDIDGFTAAFARNGERVINGQIYVAPPDQHMLLVDGHVQLSRGPRENFSRPAIDPLFRSAALAYGDDAIAVVLSGRLNDGTAGLYEIKRRGGTAIVQTPAEAEAPDMPRSALENVSVDYCLPVREIPRLLIRLALEPSQQRGRVTGLAAMEQTFSNPTAQTCSECGGAMRQEQAGPLTRFRCHIGHVMTAEVLAASQVQLLENDLARVLRTLNERAALCRDIAEKHIAAGNAPAGEVWMQAAGEATGRENTIARLVNMQWRHPEATPDADEAAAE